MGDTWMILKCENCGRIFYSDIKLFTQILFGREVRCPYCNSDWVIKLEVVRIEED